MGVQYESGDVMSLANSINKLATDNALRKMMVKNSYARAEYYDQHTQYQKYADTIEAVKASFSSTERHINVRIRPNSA